MVLLETFRKGPHRARPTGTIRGYLAHPAPRLKEGTGLESIVSSTGQAEL